MLETIAIITTGCYMGIIIIKAIKIGTVDINKRLGIIKSIREAK